MGYRNIRIGHYIVLLADRMEEGSEIADTDGDVHMDANFFVSERPCLCNGKWSTACLS